MTLTKVEDGLSLSRMLLCQLCGIDLSTPIVLADEQVDDLPLIPATTNFEIETAYANRPEIRSLELAAKIYQQKINVTRSEHLPSVAQWEITWSPTHLYSTVLKTSLKACGM